MMLVLPTQLLPSRMMFSELERLEQSINDELRRNGQSPPEQQPEADARVEQRIAVQRQQTAERIERRDQAQRRLHAQPGLDAGHQPGRDQRVTAQLEEVVVGADPLQVQQLGVEGRDAGPKAVQPPRFE